MQVKTSDLPGTGRRYALETAEGGTIVVILHHHGHREIYHFRDPEEDEPDFNIHLSDEEARQAGTILPGVDYQPVADDRMELLLKNIRMDWIKVQPESCLAHKRIIDSKIRIRTGSTVIASLVVPQLRVFSGIYILVTAFLGVYLFQRAPALANFYQQRRLKRTRAAP